MALALRQLLIICLFDVTATEEMHCRISVMGIHRSLLFCYSTPHGFAQQVALAQKVTLLYGP
jgi:hypothetical protein